MTAVFACADAFVAAFRGMTGYSAPGGSGVAVFDGVAEFDVSDRWLVVGGTSPFADEDAEAIVATSDAFWRTVPVTSGKQTETVVTSCVAGAWSGDAPAGLPPWSTLRGIVASIVADVTDRLRESDACDLDEVHSFTLTNGRLSQEFTPDGSFAIFQFDIVTVLSI